SLLLYAIRRKAARMVFAVVAVGYLWFFWSWGLNYHRPRLQVKLSLDPQSVKKTDIEEFTRLAAAELNRLRPTVVAMRIADDLSPQASARVRRVMERIEGQNWRAAGRIKHSIFAQGWFRIAGIEGMFNPFGHEPLVTSGLLPFEYPFVTTHELAHVWGIPNEG